MVPLQSLQLDLEGLKPRLGSSAESEQIRAKMKNVMTLFLSRTDLHVDIPQSKLDLLRDFDMESLSEAELSTYKLKYNMNAVDMATAYNRKPVYKRIFSTAVKEDDARILAMLEVVIKHMKGKRSA